MLSMRMQTAGIPCRELKIGDRITAGYMEEMRSAIVVRKYPRNEFVTVNDEGESQAHFYRYDAIVEVWSRNNPVPLERR